MHLHMKIPTYLKIRNSAILMTHYTSRDKGRMRVSCCTSHTQLLSTVAVNRNWWIIGWRIIEVLLYV
jgi:hypothetical protein